MASIHVLYNRPSIRKTTTPYGNYFYTNMRERMEEAIFSPPIISQWHKIRTLNKENHYLVDWKVLKGASVSATNYQWR